jgi:hypothetical protein
MREGLETRLTRLEGRAPERYPTVRQYVVRLDGNMHEDDPSGRVLSAEERQQVSTEQKKLILSDLEVAETVFRDLLGDEVIISWLELNDPARAETVKKAPSI